MKRPWRDRVGWTLLSKSDSQHAQHDSPHDSATTIELAQLNNEEKGPIQTVSTFRSFRLNTNARKPSPKRAEDRVADSLGADGWKFGASAAAITAGVTAVVNIGFGIWILAAAGSQDPNGRILAELFHGSCSTTARMNTWSHLAINVISTCLLAGSNYCMQCLVAPSRADVNQAHAKGRWLDIGLPSIRNLHHISRLRCCLWGLLAISSLPLHLLFNSAFFSSIGNNGYDVVFANPSYLDGAPFNYTTRQTAVSVPDLPESGLRLQQKYMQDPGAFTTLQNQECINKYATGLLTDRRSVIVITNDQPSSPENGSVLMIMSMGVSSTTTENYQWLCPIPYGLSSYDGKDYTIPGLPATYTYSNTDPCPERVNKGQIVGQDWQPTNITAEYCLSESIQEECGFYANIAIIWVVVFCNLVKLGIMSYMVFSPVITQPLMTIGDAVSSFIVDPDSTTENLGPTSIHKIKQLDKRVKPKTWSKVAATLPDRLTQHPTIDAPSRPPQATEADIKPEHKWNLPPSRQWQPSPKGPHLAASASKTRWTVVFVYFALCVSTVAVLLYIAIWRINNAPTSFAALFQRGFGKVSSDMVINGWEIESMSPDRGVVSSVLVANSPQLALSFLYFALNTLLTLMSSSIEWSRFSINWTLKNHPRSLRTTQPVGEQRRTYFLQLPFRFAVPLIFMSGLLHWLISQSIFLAVISIYDHVGTLERAFSTASCGYSPIGMIFVIMVGSILMLSILAFGSFRMEPGMPIVASCSAAISSCCHVNWQVGMFGGLDEVRLGQEAREEMVKAPVVWGELVGDNERLRFRQDEWQQEADETRYSFVSATGVDWQEKVRTPNVDRARL
ncbi:uncharacterized protein HMPREF1541_01253 [Cyphellophora europaea CBS 101466]|uniref:DUF6536 domain-containing protein n=1 Tax=Cyphellophora europaea (strain CBS 101466) TaxID=1220924 RepID=W2SGD6_CYPE1|nr:uncharacterized protein HMPREF1541_01253 [Cyphellophora europaea CBS 101466]ETN47063.1 hypothetical protein HMPREF1541_01253 [Cyphellophora europaea CBS 101466]